LGKDGGHRHLGFRLRQRRARGSSGHQTDQRGCNDSLHGAGLYDAAMPADVEAWYAALESRHLRSLTFQEVRHALQALSSQYVERREKIDQGKALDGAGKRAAFALFYGPLHFLTVSEVVRALKADDPPPATVIDLGCGTGVAAAAWARGGQERGHSPFSSVSGIDESGWAI